MELTQQAATWIDDRRLALRVMNFAITFAYTVKQILRRERLNADDLEGIIDPAEVCCTWYDNRQAQGQGRERVS